MKVSIVKCNEYDFDLLYKSIRKSFDDLGGVGRFIKEGTRVLLKPNLLMKSDPESATVTHPLFTAAIAKNIVDAGGIVTIIDSPGGLYSEKILRGLYRACGYEQVPRLSGATLCYDASTLDVHYKDGKLLHDFTVIKPLSEHDIVISAAKLKTHGFTTYTGAVKNLFGLVPGARKAEYHLRFTDVDVFCQALVDLCEYAAPTISFIDGITGMEGAGPSGGKPRNIGAVIASESPHCADLAAASIIGMKAEEVPTLKCAISRGLCPHDASELEIEGQLFTVKNYKRAVSGAPTLFNNPLFKAVAMRLSPKPVFIKSKCIKCGDCKRCCPADAIKMEPYPVLENKKCIKCFCCQELCPKKAVKIKRRINM